MPKSAFTYKYFILLNCMISKYSHGLMVRFGDGNHSNLGLNELNPNKTQGVLPNSFKFL